MTTAVIFAVLLLLAAVLAFQVMLAAAQANRQMIVALRTEIIAHQRHAEKVPDCALCGPYEWTVEAVDEAPPSGRRRSDAPCPGCPCCTESLCVFSQATGRRCDSWVDEPLDAICPCSAPEVTP